MGRVPPPAFAYRRNCPLNGQALVVGRGGFPTHPDLPRSRSHIPGRRIKRGVVSVARPCSLDMKSAFEHSRSGEKRNFS